MIELVAVKAFFKNIWEWFERNWKLATGTIIAIALYIYHKVKLSRVKEVVNIKEESNKQQIKKIEEINEQANKERDTLIEEYAETIKEIEAKFRENKKRVTKKRKEEIQNIVKEVGDNPAEIAKRLSDQFGIAYEPSSKE